MGAAVLTACLLGGLPFAATAANSGGTVEGYNGNRFYRYVGDGSGDVIIESENDTYGGNPVTLQGVFGGRQETGDVENRTIIIGDATHAPNIREAYGGKTANGSANNNTLTFQNGRITGAYSIYGGTCLTGSADHNTVTITGNAKTDGQVFGGSCGSSASWNSVNIEGSAEVGGNVWGGSSEHRGSVAEHNTVTISGGSVKGDVIGGASGGNGKATHNTVTISGGSVGKNVIGGQTTDSYGKAINNTVRISGTPTLSSATLYGGRWDGFFCNDISTGNTLEILNSGISVAGVENFEKLAFTLPATITKGGTMLTASGSVVFPASATISVMVAGTQVPALNAGDEITLIEAAPLAITPTLTPATAASYFTVDKDSTGKKLIATALTDLAALPAHAVYGSTPQGGEVTCDQPKVTEGIGATTCTATASAIAAAGATFDPDSMTVSSGTGTLINCRENTCTLTGVTSEVTVTATFTLNEYSVSDATPTGAGGTMDCPSAKVTYFDTPTCTAQPDTGYIFTGATATYANGSNANISCDTDTKKCTLTGVLDDVTVTGVFSPPAPPTPQPPQPQPQQPRQPYVISNTPTMGELGLLLSGLALAGAAAPALRQRERKARKHD
ncbi:MAG: hypothetical protein IJM64_10125 [Ottowia sp.]|nr:hypothetical protein [Ottowia sp.]